MEISEVTLKIKEWKLDTQLLTFKEQNYITNKDYIKVELHGNIGIVYFGLLAETNDESITIIDSYSENEIYIPYKDIKDISHEYSKPCAKLLEDLSSEAYK